MKTLDFNATEARAEKMTVNQLRHALVDCVKTALIWDAQRDDDADGNAGYYHDEASVYRAELTRRGFDGTVRAWEVRC